MKVLVADDDNDLRAIIAEHLERQGFEVIHATNGLETLLQVKRERPEALILDIHMPRLGGLEALRRVRSFDPGMNVVVVTGYLDPELHDQALALGVRNVLAKPIDFGILTSLLRGAESSASRSRKPRVAASEPVAVPTASASAGHILVIDHDPGIRSMLDDFLTPRDFRVTTAGDATLGMRALIESPPDIVLLDVVMPGLTGAEAFPAIRAVVPDAAVIMMSGAADEVLAKRALAQGAFDFLMKPLDLTYLALALETALAMKRLGL
jgi:DNA-binding NtrC family response regulator